MDKSLIWEESLSPALFYIYKEMEPKLRLFQWRDGVVLSTDLIQNNLFLTIKSYEFCGTSIQSENISQALK